MNQNIEELKLRLQQVRRVRWVALYAGNTDIAFSYTMEMYDLEDAIREELKRSETNAS